MGFLFYFTLVFLSFASLSALQTQTQEIKSARLLDLVIRDYTFKSYNKHFRTGKLHQIKLPANLSGITVNSVRFRCGSLQRYGAKIKEFHLGIGVTVHPCIERVLIIRQNLGSNWSSIYYDNYELSGYRLISPVLGLLAYNIGDGIKFSTPSELGIQAGKQPITVDFSNTTRLNITSGVIPLCVSFDHDGKVTLTNQASPNICIATRHGHFGLVVESPLIPMKKKTLSKWKITIGSTIGAALGAFLLSLLLIAMFVNAKKKARMDELERRAYEEEALQVSMVGHVSTRTASSTRTLPRIEHDDEYT
ncbi:uncharacterized protein LOC111379044 [Olea europaea var. sylvestris]|uniref:uncharacterized protein LOC111379044 n=1 Tax=Olea europaea var. sylvestris TaxID=158386 RepID=UPI000C1D4317|nr:uncharacterized protein LOC111379044 [Olea europaea var. sylvestris]